MTGQRMSRSAWGPVAPSSTPRPYTASPAGIAVHWTGVPMNYRRDPAQVLRDTQRYHMSNGSIDIQYSLAVDWDGRVWDARGLRVVTGANGGGAVNRGFTSVLAMCGPGNPIPQAMVDGLREAVRWHREVWPTARRVTTHRAVRPSPTACPGDDLTSLVLSGGLEPVPTTPFVPGPAGPVEGDPMIRFTSDPSTVPGRKCFYRLLLEDNGRTGKVLAYNGAPLANPDGALFGVVPFKQLPNPLAGRPLGIDVVGNEVVVGAEDAGVFAYRRV